MDPPYHAHAFDGALAVIYNAGAKENADAAQVRTHSQDALHTAHHDGGGGTSEPVDVGACAGRDADGSDGNCPDDVAPATLRERAPG